MPGYYLILQKKYNRVLPVIVAIDTGMGRIGYLTDCEENVNAAVEEIKAIKKLSNVSLEGIISHFSMLLQKTLTMPSYKVKDTLIL